MAHVPLFGELDERHLARQYRSHPMSALHHVGWRKQCKRTLRLLDRREPAPNLGQVVCGEAFTGADVACEDKLTCVVRSPSRREPMPTRDPSGSV